ncbi:MAG: hypothetical protein AAFN30_05335 [Actinomycetota bacterium]
MNIDRPVRRERDADHDDPVQPVTPPAERSGAKILSRIVIAVGVVLACMAALHISLNGLPLH